MTALHSVDLTSWHAFRFARKSILHPRIETASPVDIGREISLRTKNFMDKNLYSSKKATYAALCSSVCLHHVRYVSDRDHWGVHAAGEVQESVTARPGALDVVQIEGCQPDVSLEHVS